MLNCLSHQRLSAAGISIGSFDLTPPILDLQQNVTELGPFRPHIGVGLGYEFSKNNDPNQEVKRLDLSANAIPAGISVGEFKFVSVPVGVGYRL